MTPEQLDLTFTRLSQLSRAYGAPTIDMAERVLQRAAAGQLLSGVVFLVGGAAIGLGAAWCIRRMNNYALDGSLAGDLGCIFGSTFGSVLAVAGIVSGSLMLSDVWAWTALTDPSLALAHDIFGSTSR